MDIARIMELVVRQLNEKDECGLCWKLVLGGRRDYFNNEKDQASNCGEDCCVRVGVLDIGSVDIYKEDDFFPMLVARDYNLEIIFGMPSRMDLQFYNEVSCDVANSKWAKYLSPMQCCLENFQINFCGAYTGCNTDSNQIEVKAFSMKMFLNYGDKNLDGWRAIMRIRKHLQ